MSPGSHVGQFARVIAAIRQSHLLRGDALVYHVASQSAGPPQATCSEGKYTMMRWVIKCAHVCRTVWRSVARPSRVRLHRLVVRHRGLGCALHGLVGLDDVSLPSSAHEDQNQLVILGDGTGSSLRNASPCSAHQCSRPVISSLRLTVPPLGRFFVDVLKPKSRRTA